MASPSRPIPGMIYTFLVAGSLLALSAPAESMCIPFSCDLCDIRSAGQANWVLMNRDAGTITLIPNIHISGNGEDFALLLPLPTIPEVASVPDTIWQQAFRLTAPQASFSPNGLGCSNVYEDAIQPAEPRDDSVQIIRETHVGAFILTTVQAQDPSELVDWLNQNGFEIPSGAAEKFRSFTDRAWFFCAMRLDPTAVKLEPQWDVSVDPVAFTFEATKLEVPLSLLSINRETFMPMYFFVVDAHRSALADFRTVYANRISEREFAAVREEYPELASYLRPGMFLTRLDQTFRPGTLMTGSIFVTQAPDDQEQRRTFPSSMSGDGILFGFLTLLVSARIRRRLRLLFP